MSRRHWLMLVVLSGLWGASFMFIKIGDRELEPTTLIFLRLAIGALVLAPITFAKLGAARVGRELRAFALPLTLTGLVNSAIPIVLIAWAETRLDSGLTAVIQASAPLFTALLALAFVRSERVNGMRLAGLLVGFAGVALLVGGRPSGEGLAAVAVVISALCYAVAALYSGRRLGGASSLTTAFGTLTAASVVLAPFAIAQAPSQFPSWEIVLSVLALGIGGTGIAYVLYYALISGAGASNAILITYLVPAVALFYGSVFLSEPVTAAALGGLALILGGVALGSGALRLGRRKVPASVRS
jgi:drug/metabolite transporter (DMT)-like permease